jgi:PAS domain S-box-containing protein
LIHGRCHQERISICISHSRPATRWAVLDSGQPVINFEEPGLDFEGNRVSILTTKIPLRDGEGKVIGLVGVGRDITERKKVEAKLQSSESRYRLATQATKDVIWEWNREDNQLIWTENAQLVFGYAPEEIPTAGWWDDHIHPEDRERVTSKLNTLITTLGGESVWSDEYRFQLKNGSYAYIADHAYIERDPTGTTIRMIGAMANITERKRTEEALRESEEHYRAIFDGVQDAIFVESLDGKILMVNDRACEMFGYSHAEFLTKTVADLVPRNHQILMADNLDSSLSAEPHETVNQRANGEVFPIEISGRLQVINGETVLLVVIRDITGQKRAEEALRESERRYRALFEDTPIAIWEEDFSEVKKHLDSLKQQGITDFREYFATHPEAVITCADMIRVVGVNNATLQMYHAGSKDDLLEKINQGLSNSELKYLQEAFIGITERRTSYRWEGTDKTITGEAVKIYVSASVTPGHESDYSRVIVTIATTDITEQKRAEEALHQSEALYRQAIEVAGAVPYLESYYDEGKKIKYEFMGEGIREITGYGPEEFSATLWDSLVEEVNLVEDLAGYSIEEGIERVRAGENSIWKCEHRLRDREGNIHWVFEAAVELRDENGVSHGSIGTYQDITTRKLAEEAEREQRVLAEALRDTAETLSSSLSYEEVLDHILAAVGRVVPHDAATVMLIDGDFARVVRSYGYDQRGFDLEIMGIRLPLAETHNLREMLETRQPVIVYDTRTYPGWMRLDATDWLGSNVGAPISIQDNVIGFILLDSQMPGFFTPIHAERLEAFANQAAIAMHNAHLLQQAQEEIAERKRAEEALRAEREKAQKYLDIAGVTMLALDQDGIVTLINQKGCEILGYSADEIMGKNWINTFLPETIREEMQGVLQQLISGDVEPVGYYENTVLTKNGEEFDCVA